MTLHQRQEANGCHIPPDLTVRTLGGYSLLVLAR